MNNGEYKEMLSIANMVIKQLVTKYKTSFKYDELRTLCNQNIEMTNTLILYVTDMGFKFGNGELK